MSHARQTCLSLNLFFLDIKSGYVHFNAAMEFLKRIVARWQKNTVQPQISLRSASDIVQGGAISGTTLFAIF